MTTTIHVTANGNCDGEGEHIPMAVWHAFLKEHLREVYPDADIFIRGEANVYGGSSAIKVDVDDENEEPMLESDICDEIERAWVAACDKVDLWVPNKQD
jgi:hypothetical protein